MSHINVTHFSSEVSGDGESRMQLTNPDLPDNGR